MLQRENQCVCSCEIATSSNFSKEQVIAKFLWLHARTMRADSEGWAGVLQLLAGSGWPLTLFWLLATRYPPPLATLAAHAALGAHAMHPRAGSIHNPCFCTLLRAFWACSFAG